MKKLIFVLLTLLICTTPVFAAINIDVDDDGAGKVSISGTSDYAESDVSIKIYDSTRSYFIEQGKTNINGDFEFSFELDDQKKEYDGKINICTNGESLESKSFTIYEGNTDTNPINPEKVKVKLAVVGKRSNLLYFSNSVRVSENSSYGLTVGGALDATDLDWHKTWWDSEGAWFIDEIEGEKDEPPNGWMYTINGKLGGPALDEPIEDDDVIIWYYSISMDQEPPSWSDILDLKSQANNTAASSQPADEEAVKILSSPSITA